MPSPSMLKIVTLFPFVATEAIGCCKTRTVITSAATKVSTHIVVNNSCLKAYNLTPICLGEGIYIYTGIFSMHMMV